MFYGIETWCQGEDEMMILRRTERAMMRATNDDNLIKKRNSQKVIDLLGVGKTLAPLS